MQTVDDTLPVRIPRRGKVRDLSYFSFLTNYQKWYQVVLCFNVALSDNLPLTVKMRPSHISERTIWMRMAFGKCRTLPGLPGGDFQARLTIRSDSFFAYLQDVRKDMWPVQFIMSSSKSRPLEHHEGPKGEIMRMGYLKKLKVRLAGLADQFFGSLLKFAIGSRLAVHFQTMKKKFFILRGESSEASARLEYYDSEKKWRNSQPPKRTISLKTCFNINRRRDTKQKYVIALYTKDDCFCIVLESEEELQEWLKVLLKLQTGEDCVDGEPPKPTFSELSSCFPCCVL